MILLDGHSRQTGISCKFYVSNFGSTRHLTEAAVWHRGSVCTSHPASLGSILSVPEILIVDVTEILSTAVARVKCTSLYYKKTSNRRSMKLLKSIIRVVELMCLQTSVSFCSSGIIARLLETYFLLKISIFLPRKTLPSFFLLLSVPMIVELLKRSSHPFQLIICCQKAFFAALVELERDSAQARKPWPKVGLTLSCIQPTAVQ